MQKNQLVFNDIAKIGYVSTKVPSYIITALREEINEQYESNFRNLSKYNNFLAGAIENEYRLSKSIGLLDEYVKTLVPFYWQQFNTDNARKWENTPFEIKRSQEGAFDVWVNYQKKHEYNPLHYHHGVLSFVIWLKIPYDINKESSLPMYQTKAATSPGIFKFVVPNPYIDESSPYGYSNLIQKSITVSSDMENTLILFPACLCHEVHPFFTSDELRISVAGNINPVINDNN